MPSYSVPDIWNLALVKLGQEDFVASESESTANAAACRAAYYITRDKLLRDYEWSFAVARADLSRSSFDGDDWTYQYALPTEPPYLRALDIPEEDVWDADFLWKKEGDVILSNATSLTLRYISLVTDTTKYPPDFVDALACALAIQVCWAITGSRSKLRELKEDYRMAIDHAQGSGAIERAARIFRSTWAERDGPPSRNYRRTWRDRDA